MSDRKQSTDHAGKHVTLAAACHAGTAGRIAAERLSPAAEPGTHVYDRSPDFRYAIETYSSFAVPEVVRLVRLPGHQVIRTLVDNQRLRNQLAGIRDRQLQSATTDGIN